MSRFDPIKLYRIVQGFALFRIIADKLTILERGGS